MATYLCVTTTLATSFRFRALRKRSKPLGNSDFPRTAIPTRQAAKGSRLYHTLAVSESTVEDSKPVVTAEEEHELNVINKLPSKPASLGKGVNLVGIS